MKILKTEEILTRNPHINEETLKKYLELLKKIRARGIKGRRYNIISPYERRISKAKSHDHRIMHARRSSR